MRDTIFISHAYPQNNYFAAWLASKLKLLGYKVWVDVSDIKPGQYFNQEFENALKNDAIRFLPVISADYIAKSKIPDSGVMNEILLARTIRNIDNFIIPLKYDNSDFGDFGTGLIGRLVVPFDENWAIGLHELVKYFEELNIPKVEQAENAIQFWHDAQKIASEPLKKNERYLTNWFPIEMPDFIYIHQPDFFIEKEFVNLPFTYLREGDRLITFASSDTLSKFTMLKSSYIFPTSDFIKSENLKVDEKLSIIEPNKKLVNLLNKIFKSCLIRRHLRIYEQANKKEIFHFSYSPENKKMVSLKNIGKSRRSIIGISSEITWFFAISHSAALFPSPNYKIFYHLVFTDKKGKYLTQDEQHELRRSVPSDWYNREWLEKLLAMMLKIAEFSPDNTIKVPVDFDKYLSINVMPVDVISEIGYNEPSNETKS